MRCLKGAEVTSGQSSLTCGRAPGMHVHVLEFPLNEMTQIVQTLTPFTFGNSDFTLKHLILVQEVSIFRFIH